MLTVVGRLANASDAEPAASSAVARSAAATASTAHVRARFSDASHVFIERGASAAELRVQLRMGERL